MAGMDIPGGNAILGQPLPALQGAEGSFISHPQPQLRLLLLVAGGAPPAGDTVLVQQDSAAAVLGLLKAAGARPGEGLWLCWLKLFPEISECHFQHTVRSRGSFSACKSPPETSSTSAGSLISFGPPGTASGTDKPCLTQCKWDEEFLFQSRPVG